jgi:hypothetical protein
VSAEGTQFFKKTTAVTDRRYNQGRVLQTSRGNPAVEIAGWSSLTKSMAAF